MAKLTALEKELRILAAKNHHPTLVAHATTNAQHSTATHEEASGDDDAEAAAHVTHTQDTHAAAAAASSPSTTSTGRTGSRFDILTTGVIAEGQMCSKWHLRQATRACHAPAAAAATPVASGGTSRSGRHAVAHHAVGECPRTEEESEHAAACLTMPEGGNDTNTAVAAAALEEGGNCTTSPKGSKKAQPASPPSSSAPSSPSPLTSSPRPPQSAASRGQDEVGKRCQLRSNPPYTKLCPQVFSHLLICDFECTCAELDPDFPYEIIEFPVVVLDTATLRVVGEFHSYVKPVLRPTLTPFCTELTGITQAVVSAAETLPVVLQRFSAWLQATLYPLCRQWRTAHTLRSHTAKQVASSSTCELDGEDSDEGVNVVVPENKCGEASAEEAMVCFVTDGPSDMHRFMYKCSVLRDGVDFPPLFYRYVDVRQCFAKCLSQRQVSLKEMLRKLGMRFVGKHHSGIDDARNIARVMAELLARGHRIGRVFSIPYCVMRGDKEQRRRLAAALQEKKDRRHGRHGPHRPARRR